MYLIGSSTHADVIEFSNFLCQLKNQRSGSKTVYGFSVMIFVEQNINFNKNETELKMENSAHSF